MDNIFGGPWTEEKLNILRGYLNSYTTALKKYSFEKIYIDAFAGTGNIKAGSIGNLDGSAKIALGEDFDRYIFIEKQQRKCEALKGLVHRDFPLKEFKVEVIKGDANTELKKVVARFRWNKERAAVFLDPYGIKLDYSTLDYLAKTRAVDVWYLFSLMGAQRMLKNTGVEDPTWRTKLCRLFGDDSWEKEFYHESAQGNLFGNPEIEKDANTEKVYNYICRRLENIFPKVARTERVFSNSRNSNMFLFLFAVASENRAAQDLALKIANYLLEKW